MPQRRLPQPPLRRTLLIAGLAMLGCMGLASLVHTQVAQAAPGSATSDLIVRDAYVRESLPGTDFTAAYFTLQNTGSRAVTLVGIHTAAADMAMLHETTIQGGMERMRPHASLTLAPGETVTLKPGGLHVMLHGVHAPLKPGMRIELSLELADGRSVSVSAPVRALGSS
jgi:periplasmic copper chaperone A